MKKGTSASLEAYYCKITDQLLTPEGTLGLGDLFPPLRPGYGYRITYTTKVEQDSDIGYDELGILIDVLEGFQETTWTVRQPHFAFDYDVNHYVLQFSVQDQFFYVHIRQLDEVVVEVEDRTKEEGHRHVGTAKNSFGVYSLIAHHLKMPPPLYPRSLPAELKKLEPNF